VDSVLKAFSIGFLLRSLFAGVFFVVSYRVAGDGITALKQINPGVLFSVGLPVAVLAGVTIYSLHRSLIYPWIEFALNSNRMEKWRRKVPLISTATLETLRKLWSAGVEKEKTLEAFARHTATWADYTHLQYTSALCIAVGSLARRFTDPGVYCFHPLLLPVTLVFFIAAATSDWRLHAVREKLMRVSSISTE
jgi:hypothetical protein